MGRWCTILGVLVSIGTAYLVMQFKQHHGLRAGAVQLLHRAAVRHRAAGHAVEARDAEGRLLGTAGAAPFPRSRMWAWVKADPSALAIMALSSNAKAMAENMYRALWSWLICVIVTVVVSYMTTPDARNSNWSGLVYGCTELPSEGHLPLCQRPVFWAAMVAVVFVILQIMFW